ncbi:glycosyltransferase involved in cell wall biosynthesis [Variovorax boronicumulans]|uniref:glycosyltransferase n=1 Tax=Variovorax boronicumulans TaxID=436515 RepID=UPI0027879031|nr:glycosyltransferase [Variovorax boronicumulans]MDP9990119.1 glycosyltransferase involved in cell wall biosynthesis [Variovorax boronicumulans]MDQ0001373.1 glycosyltransferase involved in cell wall biosynthesis [Variovorax boronicumulans]
MFKRFDLHFMPNNGWIAYVGPFPFPWGQAASRRMVGIARSFAESGYSVVVAGGASLPLAEQDLNEGEPKGSVRYIGVGESPVPRMPSLKKIWRVFFEWGQLTVQWLDRQPSKPTHVVVYGGSAQYMLRLLPWCRQHGIPLIVDVVEWYDPRQMKGGRFGPFYLSAQFALRYLYPRCDGVIAISSLLEDRYRKLGCEVVRVPPSLDVQAERSHIQLKNPEDPLVLVYAGTPGKKDLLRHVLEAVEAVDPTGARLKLKVLGPTVEQLKASYGRSNFAPSIQILGRINQEEIASHICSAHFTVLLRMPALFTNAGFPTKFVESLANGTPVIANLTSDLGLYLRDGVEGLVCADYSVHGLSLALERALSLSGSQLEKMRQAAINQAKQSFDFRVHSKNLHLFLSSIKRVPR